MLFQRPSNGAVIMLATFVFGGVGLAYLPTQLQDTWQARWGPWLSTLGLIVAALAVVGFGATHIRWPHWTTDLGRLRLRFYKKPYGPDVFSRHAQDHLAGFFKVTKRTVALDPAGWDERDPFIRITYHIFNGSQFEVLFGDPKGDLYLSGSKLHDNPTIPSGHGGWRSHVTAQLKIDQRLKLEFWEELAENANGSVIEQLTGGFNVSLEAKAPGMEEVRIGLSADTPFFREESR